jgi:aminoglycoside phosphotransferase (APT) family kinase protein
VIENVAAMIEKASPGSDIAEIVPRSGGQLSTVFEVLRTAADPLIVKIYEPGWSWTQAKEVHVYGLLAGHLGACVPQVVHAETGNPAFTVLTKIDGIPLSEAEPPEWKPIYEQLGQLLAKIHRIPQPAYGYLTDQVLDPLPTNDEYMRHQFAKKLKEFDELDGDPARRDDITGTSNSTPDCSRPRQPPPCATTTSTKATCSWIPPPGR